MSIIELEAQKASLAREILCMEDETIIKNIWLMLDKCNLSAYQQKTPKKRQLGILDGKAKVTFRDDWEMTTEELLELQ